MWLHENQMPPRFFVNLIKFNSSTFIIVINLIKLFVIALQRLILIQFLNVWNSIAYNLFNINLIKLFIMQLIRLIGI